MFENDKIFVFCHEISDNCQEISLFCQKVKKCQIWILAKNVLNLQYKYRATSQGRSFILYLPENQAKQPFMYEKLPLRKEKRAWRKVFGKPMLKKNGGISTRFSPTKQNFQLMFVKNATSKFFRNIKNCGGVDFVKKRVFFG